MFKILLAMTRSQFFSLTPGKDVARASHPVSHSLSLSL